MKAILLVISATVLPLCAQFISPLWEGDENTEYAEWDFFTEASVDPNFPDVAQDEPTNDATVTCSTPSAFVTSSRNIYSFLSPLSFQLDDSAEFPVRNVVLQIFSQGSELDLNSLQLIPGDAQSLDDIVIPNLVALLDQEALTGVNGGLGSSYLVQWDLSEAPLTGTYSLLFSSEESSMSLDKLSLHTSDTFVEVILPKVAAEEVTAPSLRVEGENIIVSWPLASSGDLILEMTSDLSDAESWTEVVHEPTETESEYEQSFPLSNGSFFFRLANQ